MTMTPTMTVKTTDNGYSLIRSLAQMSATGNKIRTKLSDYNRNRALSEGTSCGGYV